MSPLNLSNVRFESLTNGQEIVALKASAEKKLEEIAVAKEKTTIIDWTSVEERLNAIIRWCDLQPASSS